MTGRSQKNENDADHYKDDSQCREDGDPEEIAANQQYNSKYNHGISFLVELSDLGACDEISPLTSGKRQHSTGILAGAQVNDPFSDRYFDTAT